ncbi:hypothetical protein E2986_13235 [Frieseomelitta varia]|uniref:Uncharacterized protein n=1 Tax=Frieseomelitta varia TaxID=561572 RepID=A0A833RRJ5_9HYME|nr:hypothetical protein E2986_13235 [Frieseomelitta varia]
MDHKELGRRGRPNCPLESLSLPRITQGPLAERKAIVNDVKLHEKTRHSSSWLNAAFRFSYCIK